MPAMSKPTQHGGDPSALEAIHGKPADGWLDLSTGINPDGYPVSGLGEADWRGLPTAAQMAALKAVARSSYGVPRAAAEIVAAPGSQALIQWLPRLRPAGHVAVLGPTYSEHGPAWRDAGHRVASVESVETLADADVAVLCNPNNPDGRTIEPERLLSLHARLAAKGGWLIVDEAFADAEPGASLAAATGLPGLIVLRSLGKFFGLAGLRLGFALTDPGTRAALGRALGPWAVSTPAAIIGARALGDSAWIAATRQALPERAARLDRLLAAAGFEIIGGTALFRLVRSVRAEALFADLAGAGVCARRFSDRPDILRFGLPAATAWERLGAALAYLPVPALGGS
jgi:cobalamin biosynthetic protein CobC